MCATWGEVNEEGQINWMDFNETLIFNGIESREEHCESCCSNPESQFNWEGISVEVAKGIMGGF